MTTGEPHGSFLGALLFLVSMDGFASAVKHLMSSLECQD